MSEQIKIELLSIKEQSDDGLLRPDAVVAWAAENPESAIHGALEWDDAAAAHEYRLHQVRGLIRLHVVNAEGEPQLVSLSFDRAKTGGYRHVDEVAASRDLSAILLKDALAELERVQAKYERVQDLTKVWTEVKAAKRRVKSAPAPETSPEP